MEKMYEFDVALGERHVTVVARDKLSASKQGAHALGVVWKQEARNMVIIQGREIRGKALEKLQGTPSQSAGADSSPSRGSQAERCRRQSKRGERVAAVGKIEEQRKPDDFSGTPQQGSQGERCRRQSKRDEARAQEPGTSSTAEAVPLPLKGKALGWQNAGSPTFKTGPLAGQKMTAGCVTERKKMAAAHKRGGK